MVDRVSQSPGYREQVEDITADKRGRVILASTLRRLQPLLLDVAQAETPLRVNGDYLYADPDSTGKIYVKLNSGAEDAFPLTAQAAVEGIPIKDILVSWAAQPGLVMNLWYGYQARFKPPQQSIASIGSILTPVNLNPEDARYFLFGDDEVMDGEAFMAAWPTGAVAGQFGFTQLFNPAGSGKFLYLDKLSSFGGGGAIPYRINKHNVAIGALATLGFSKNVSDGAVGVGQVRQGANAAILGVQIGYAKAMLDDWMEKEFKPGLRIVEGWGVHVANETVNTSQNSTLEWREKLT